MSNKEKETAQDPLEQADAVVEQVADIEIEDGQTAEMPIDNDEAIMALETEITDLKDRNLRLLSDFTNYKQRTNREKIELIQNGGRETIIKLLPILDDFDRAKMAADQSGSDEQFPEGVSLVYQKMISTLKAMGVEKMVSTGEIFDPEHHEAITEIPAPAPDQVGFVIDTVEPGYFLNDKILRYAKVVVGK